MPLTSVGLASKVSPALLSCGFTGVNVPQLSLGISTGVCTWLSSSAVSIAGVGTFGVGGVSTPLVVPSVLLTPNFVNGFAGSAIVGTWAATLATALGVGLSQGFAQGLITAVFPSVGTGTGVAHLVYPPPDSFLTAGLASAGITGLWAPVFAHGVSVGLSATFASLFVPVAIVGPSSPTASSGVTTGKIV